MRTLVGQLLMTDGVGRCETRPGRVHLDEETIGDVELFADASAIPDPHRDTLICPGFVDAHLHLPQFDSIGAAGMPLLPWLNKVIFPAESRWNDLLFAQEMIQRVIRQCLSVGTTAICAFSTVSHDATLAALEAFAARGFRGVIGQALMDEGAPDPLLRPTNQLIDELSFTLDRFPPEQRLATAVTPRYILSCSAQLLDAASALADERAALMQTHLAENRDECAAVESVHGNYVEAYARHGLLSERAIFAHGIHLNESDRAKLAKSRSMIAHCPTANQFLSSGTMDRAQHLAAGIRLVIGSDIGAGYERSMVRVGRGLVQASMQIAETGSRRLPAIATAPEAWHQITAGNAGTLGWNDVGELRQGASADLVIARPDIPWRSATCPLSALMWSWDDRWVAETVLRGKTVYQAGGRGEVC
ncbi:MAG: amidohydrolase family protein [Planctomycetota bacterium]